MIRVFEKLTMKMVLFSVTLFVFGVTGAAEPSIPQKDLQNAQAAIIMINHINWVVNRIKSTNNVGVLELEYEGISLNKLNLQSIKDQEVIDQITNLCGYITSLRIEDGERKMLQRELQFNMDNAIFEAFPSPGAIVAADPWAIAYNLVQNTVSSFANYMRTVKQLKIQDERKQWELEKAAIARLNSLNVDLLSEQWRLIQGYKLDDYWRVSEEQVNQLLARINSPISNANSSEYYDFLNSDFQRKKYQKLPAYWYYLGCAAEKEKHDEVALDAYNHYQEEFLQILRFDRMAASVAMNKTLLLLKKKAPEKDIREQLQIIEKNAPEDWTFLYFCASVYTDNLNDKTNANRVLDQAINLLQFQFSETLFTCRDLCKKKELAVGDHTFPNAMPLIACHVLKLRLAGQDENPAQLKALFENFQKDSAKNCFGMLSFYNKIPFDEIATYIKPTLRSMFIDYQYDNSFRSTAPYRFVLRMPLSWFFAGSFDVKMKVTFKDGTTPLEVGLHPRYKDPNPVVDEDELVRYVFDCPSSIVRGAKPDTIEVTLDHQYYPVTISFDASVLENASTREENSIRMYSTSAQYKKQTIKAR